MEDVYWECFFNNAGISGPASKDYASIFVKNKISKPILVHINDNYLKSMGIEAIGDIIRILKYIKDFPQTEIVSKSIQEKSERFVEARTTSETCKMENVNNIKLSTTTYERIPGCEVPVATRRVVNPEIEGRYKIIKPTKSIFPTTNPIPNLDRSMTQSNRIVILSETANREVERKSSVLKRLGKSLEKYEKLTSGNNINDNNNCDGLEKSVQEINDIPSKIQIADNKTILKRFFNASLSKEDNTKISLSKKLPVKNIVQTNKGNVFLRLGNQNGEDDDNDDNDYEVDGDDIEESICFSNPKSLPYMGVFKLPNVKRMKSDRIKVRSGHTTESIRKVEATSTTSSFQSIRIDVKAQSIKDRLGRR